MPRGSQYYVPADAVSDFYKDPPMPATPSVSLGGGVSAPVAPPPPLQYVPRDFGTSQADFSTARGQQILAQAQRKEKLLRTQNWAERKKLQDEIDAYDMSIRGGAPTPDSVVAQNSWQQNNANLANNAAAANRQTAAGIAQQQRDTDLKKARIAADAKVKAAQVRGSSDAEPPEPGSTQTGRTESTSVAPAAPIPQTSAPNLPEWADTAAKNLGRHNQNTKLADPSQSKVETPQQIQENLLKYEQQANEAKAATPPVAQQTAQEAPPAPLPARNFALQNPKDMTDDQVFRALNGEMNPALIAKYGGIEAVQAEAQRRGGPKQGGSMTMVDANGNRASVTTTPDGQDTKTYNDVTGRQIDEKTFQRNRQNTMDRLEQKRQSDLLAKNVNDMTASEYQDYLKLRLKRGTMRSTQEQRNDSRDAVLRGETSITDTNTGNVIPVGRGPLTAAQTTQMTSDEQRAYAGRVNSNYADAAAARTNEIQQDFNTRLPLEQAAGRARIAANTAQNNADLQRLGEQARGQATPPSVSPIVSTVPLPPQPINTSLPAPLPQSTQAGRQFMRQATATPRLLNPTPTVPSMYETPAAGGGMPTSKLPVAGGGGGMQPNPDGTFSNPAYPGARFQKVPGGYKRI